MKKLLAPFFALTAFVVMSGCSTPQTADGQGESSASSVIETALYDAENQTLTVTFENTASYRFLNLPEEVYEAYMNAESQGEFFNTTINGSYRYEEIQ